MSRETENIKLKIEISYSKRLIAEMDDKNNILEQNNKFLSQRVKCLEDTISIENQYKYKPISSNVDTSKTKGQKYESRNAS